MWAELRGSGDRTPSASLWRGCRHRSRAVRNSRIGCSESGGCFRARDRVSAGVFETAPELPPRQGKACPGSRSRLKGAARCTKARRDVFADWQRWESARRGCDRPWRRRTHAFTGAAHPTAGRAGDRRRRTEHCPARGGPHPGADRRRGDRAVHGPLPQGGDRRTGRSAAGGDQGSRGGAGRAGQSPQDGHREHRQPGQADRGAVPAPASRPGRARSWRTCTCRSSPSGAPGP